ncbi:hypothetical protein CLOSBL3_13134 [Clostridiaceae bacterium BL-3]|nr:hypothetical protein CLOSBL3_13134 [Clostridiaceae bacterium BL-3]
MNFNDIKAHFTIKEDHGDSCKAICPVHPDNKASLSIKYDKCQGKTILYCHAGCEVRKILDSVGLKMSDLFDKPLEKNSSKMNIEAVYHYKDKDNKVLFDKVRFKPKRFTQRRIIDGATVWGLDGGTYYETYPGSNSWSKKKRNNAASKQFDLCKPVIYNLPEVIQAVNNGKPVCLVEGEKDCENLSKLGFVTTTNFDGASKSSQRSKWRDEYNKYFKNCDAILIPDNDEPGRAHMKNIANSLNGIAKSIKIIELDGLSEKGDISDWLKKGGNDKDKLQNLIDKSKEWKSEETEKDLDLIPVAFNPKFVEESRNKTTILPVMENIVSVMYHYGYETKFDEINRKAFIFKDGKLQGEMDNEIIYTIKDKCLIHHLKIPPKQVEGQLYRIAIQNTFNPVRDYLLECRAKWDGNSCLKELYNTLHCDMASEKFKEKYIRKTLVNAVMLILSENIVSSQGVLVLAGEQGIGKTSWFRHLVPKKFTTNEKQLYFLEGKELELRKKDSLMEATAAWFTEIGELSSTFKKSEIDDLKNFITRPSDRFRVPYSLGAKDYRRYTQFVATVNDEEFLNDDTGNRRWWVLKCDSIDYNHDVDMDKVWGESVYLWESGKETNYFTKEEIKQINEYNSIYQSLDETALLIMSNFNFKDELRYWMKASDVFEIIGKPRGCNTKKLSAALSKLKLTSKSGHAGYKYYAMPPAKGNYIDMKQFERANYVDVKEVDSVSEIKNVSMFGSR